MQKLFIIGFVILTIFAQPTGATAQCPALLDFKFRPLGKGEPVRLCDRYQGKVLLVVNTASKCAFTPQYEGLENLYDKYKNEGLVVLGFPSNDFGAQEPGTEKQIGEFCRLTYGVQFPMFEKTHASRDRAHPLYKMLGDTAGEYPRWNFHKYLIDRDGQLVDSFQSGVSPNSPRLVRQIEKLL